MKKRENYEVYGKGFKYEKNGWLFVHIEGEPYERGFQYGYLAKEKYAKALENTKYMTCQTTGMPYEFFVEQAAKLTRGKIPRELLDEMRGFAAGLTHAGLPSTLDEIIGWNAYPGVAGYWWPSQGYKEYRADAPQGCAKGHCSAFVAAGDATTDKKIVIGHETFEDFWNGGAYNVLVDIKPTEGCRILMQSAPGFVMSMTDFFICKSQEQPGGAGPRVIAGLETTIVQTSTYDIEGIPEWVRVREAMQYGYTVDNWIKIMQEGNNGACPGSWLLGQMDTGEITRFEQGYRYQKVDKKTDGYFFGCNAVEDPRIRNLECSNVGYSDIRQQTGGRRARWPQLLEEHNGKIDIEAGKIMLADTWDIYHKQDRGAANTICSMYDIDPRYNFSYSQGIWPEPFYPAGSLDGKLTSTDLAMDMKMEAIWGRANGIPFPCDPDNDYAPISIDQWIKEHPQWAWQKRCLEPRPSQSWTPFRAEEKEE